MKQDIERSALVWHPAQRMFDLVNDIESYPAFLPWCSAAEVHNSSAAELVASLEVSKGGVRQRFTTRNWLEQPTAIQMELVEGPFSDLRGLWQFQPLSDEACKVILSLEFSLQGRLARMAFGNVFTQAASTMVDAFCQRADALYGRSP